mmetsp:Transcript_5766/g.18560  ORF Transcript_5766/g.18560 Transcript_5766/m.18560 type:complete len:406 (+) Transcript_5766:426-1643(+)
MEEREEASLRVEVSVARRRRHVEGRRASALDRDAVHEAQLRLAVALSPLRARRGAVQERAVAVEAEVALPPLHAQRERLVRRVGPTDALRPEPHVDALEDVRPLRPRQLLHHPGRHGLCTLAPLPASRVIADDLAPEGLREEAPPRLGARLARRVAEVDPPPVLWVEEGGDCELAVGASPKLAEERNHGRSATRRVDGVAAGVDHPVRVLDEHPCEEVPLLRPQRLQQRLARGEEGVPSSMPELAAAQKRHVPKVVAEPGAVAVEAAVAGVDGAPIGLVRDRPDGGRQGFVRVCRRPQRQAAAAAVAKPVVTSLLLGEAGGVVAAEGVVESGAAAEELAQGDVRLRLELRLAAEDDHLLRLQHLAQSCGEGRRVVHQFCEAAAVDTHAKRRVQWRREHALTQELG